MNFIKLTQYGANNDIYVDSDKIQVITRVKNVFKEYGAVNEYTNIHMSAPVTPDVYFIHVKETPEEILKQINRYRDEFIDALLGPEPGVPQEDAGYSPCGTPMSVSCELCGDFIMEKCPGCDRSCESEKKGGIRLRWLL